MKKHKSMSRNENIGLSSAFDVRQASALDPREMQTSAGDMLGGELQFLRQGLHGSRDLCTDYYDFAPIGFVTFDARGVIREINLTGAEMLGRERSLLLNTPFISHIIKSDRKKFLCHLEKCKQSEGKVISAICMSMERGNFFHFQLHSIVVSNPLGDSPLILTALVDISEVIEMRALAEKLTCAEENLRRSIATELRDNIRGFITMALAKIGRLAGTIDSTDQLATIEMIRESLETASCRIESLARQICLAEVYETSLESALGSLVKMAREDHNIPAEFCCDMVSFPIDEDTRTAIFQAVREFLANAARHAQAKKIIITLSMKKGNIVVKIEDNGIGFDQDRLIMPKWNEAGYGLLNARRRIEHIGGILQIDTAPGRGTCITMTAPLRDR